MFKSRFYIYSDFAEEYQSNLLKINEIHEKADFECFENAILVPLRRNLNLFKPWLGVHLEGGVFGGNLEPLAAHHVFSNTDVNICNPGFRASCVSSNPIGEITKSKETVIWGGFIMDHYGHFITDTFARLWYTVKYESDQNKIAFLIYNHKVNDEEKAFDSLCQYHIDLLNLLGISQDRILLVNTPTQFKQIIAPKQSVYWGDTYDKELSRLAYDKVRENVTPKEDKKIYLSRSKFDEDMFNEGYFEKFFEDRGFKVIYPEQLPVSEQIAYLAGADEVAATVGTLTNQILFAKDNVKLIGLLRTHKTRFVRRQCIVNKIRNANYAYVDVSINLFPIPKHFQSVYLIGPNRYWNEFIKNEYGVEEVSDISEYLNKNNILLGNYINRYIKNLVKFKINLIDYNKTNIGEDYLKSLFISFDSDKDDYKELTSALYTKNLNNVTLFNNRLFKLSANKDGQEAIIKLDQSRIVFTLVGKSNTTPKYWIFFENYLFLLNSRQECVVEFDLTDQQNSRPDEQIYTGCPSGSKEISYLLQPLKDSDYQDEIRTFKTKYNRVRLIIKLLVNKKKYKKFKRDPYRFFADSKSSLIKRLGRYFD